MYTLPKHAPINRATTTMSSCHTSHQHVEHMCSRGVSSVRHSSTEFMPSRQGKNHLFRSLLKEEATPQGSCSCFFWMATAWMIWAVFSPAHARCPASISQHSTPNEYTSAACKRHRSTWKVLLSPLDCSKNKQHRRHSHAVAHHTLKGTVQGSGG